MERSAGASWAAIAAAFFIPLLQAVFSQAVAQTQTIQPQATVAPILTTSPITGGSTLDQLRATKSDSVELQFPSGFTCRITGGDTPSLVFYGDGGQLSATVTGIQGLRAGMALIVPLYRSRRNVCDRPMTLQNALSLLEVAEKLVTAGAMTNKEYLELANRVKRDALGVQ